MTGKPLLYPLEDKESWAKKYGLKIESKPCEKCNKILTTEIPFATDDWRGLTSKPHECGEEYDIFVVTKSTEEGKEELKKLFKLLHNHLK